MTRPAGFISAVDERLQFGIPEGIHPVPVAVIPTGRRRPIPDCERRDEENTNHDRQPVKVRLRRMIVHDCLSARFHWTRVRIRFDKQSIRLSVPTGSIGNPRQTTSGQRQAPALDRCCKRPSSPRDQGRFGQAPVHAALVRPGWDCPEIHRFFGKVMRCSMMSMTICSRPGSARSAGIGSSGCPFMILCMTSHGFPIAAPKVSSMAFGHFPS